MSCIAATCEKSISQISALAESDWRVRRRTRSRLVWTAPRAFRVLERWALVAAGGSGDVWLPMEAGRRRRAARVGHAIARIAFRPGTTTTRGAGWGRKPAVGVPARTTGAKPGERRHGHGGPGGSTVDRSQIVLPIASVPSRRCSAAGGVLVLETCYALPRSMVHVIATASACASYS